MAPQRFAVMRITRLRPPSKPQNLVFIWSASASTSANSEVSDYSFRLFQPCQNGIRSRGNDSVNAPSSG